MGNIKSLDIAASTTPRQPIDFSAVGCTVGDSSEFFETISLVSNDPTSRWPKTKDGDSSNHVKLVKPNSFPDVKLALNGEVKSGIVEFSIYCASWKGKIFRTFDRSVGKAFLLMHGWADHVDLRPQLSLAFLMEIVFFGEDVPYIKTETEAFKLPGAPRFHPLTCRILENGDIVWLMWFQRHASRGKKPRLVLERRCYKFSASGEYMGKYDQWTIYFETNINPVSKLKCGPRWLGGAFQPVEERHHRATDPFAFPVGAPDNAL